jgi:hypothetical protein
MLFAFASVPAVARRYRPIAVRARLFFRRSAALTARVFAVSLTRHIAGRALWRQNSIAHWEE